MNLLIWGIGQNTKWYLKTGEIDKHNLYGFVESKKTKDFYEGKKVYEPFQLKDLDYDYVLVLVNHYTKQIKQIVDEYELDSSKFIYIDTLIWSDGSAILENEKMRKIIKSIPCSDNENIIMEKFPILFRNINERRFCERAIISTYRNAKDDIDSNVITMNDGYDSRIYSDDYFRYRTFELVADEILEEGVEGVCAEVGVYKGYFSRLINQKFKDRIMYLFDSFEGFNQEEICKTINEEAALVGWENAFSDTSEDYVMSIMPNKENCIIVKGFFPESTKKIKDEQYAFVSIDVDLEDSIFEALKYFYSRLSLGGVIFLHDYNNRFFNGVKKSVKKYEAVLGKTLTKIPIADQGGTLVIKKNLD